MKIVKVKKMVLTAVLSLLVAAVAGAETLSRSEWHAQVGECATDMAKLKDVIARIDPAEQCAFAAEVNEAISRMPGSDEMKTARFYLANRTMVASVARKNRAAMLAEVFATVPIAYLTYLNERFATELFNRNGNPKRTFTDEEFTAIAKNAMSVVNERCQKAENGDFRSAFAVLMFVRASGGTPADLAQQLVETMPNAPHKTILEEWLKPALAEGAQHTYDPMLGYSQAGEEPDHAVVTRITGGPAIGMAMQVDLQNEGSSLATSAKNLAAGTFAPSPIAGIDATGTGLRRVPRAAVLSPAPVGQGFHRQKDGTYKDANGETWRVQADGTLVSDSGKEIRNPYYRERGKGTSSREPRGPEPTPYPGQ